MKRKTRATADAVVNAIYDAALEPEGWAPCLAAIKDQFHCPSAIFFVEDTAHKQANFSLMEGLDKKRTLAYYSYYIFKDPNLKAKLGRPVGTVTASNFLMRDADWENQEYYWDFARHGRVFYQLGGTIASGPGLVGAVGLHRPKRAGGFTRRDVSALQKIIVHVRRAYQIGRTLSARDATVAEVLDRLPHAIFLVDAAGRAVLMNRHAERLLRAQDGIGLEDGRLVSRPVPGWPRLERVIHQATQTGQGEENHPGAAIALGRPSGRAPYQALVTPLRVPASRLRLGATPPRAAVFVTDPEARTLPPTDALMAWFRLTRAEARVALDLAEGRSPEEIAGARHTARGTVRAQLHAIYGKMDVARQSQLVKKVLALPHAPLEPETEPRGR
jgi:DNA-binding CsgD family transcriptional regulator